MVFDETLTTPLTAPLALVLDLLDWVRVRPRTYGETMEAWRTSCPKLPVWEDALDNGFIEVVAQDAGIGRHAVVVTEKGRAFLTDAR
jgi:hypothetical protein